MKIKICEKNREKIQKLLDEVNERYGQYKINSYDRVEVAAERAEGELESLEIPKKYRPGAAYSMVGCGSVEDAYKYKRISTEVIMTRESSGWYIWSIAELEVWPGGVRGPRLILTNYQQEWAVCFLKKRFQTWGGIDVNNKYFSPGVRSIVQERKKPIATPAVSEGLELLEDHPPQIS